VTAPTDHVADRDLVRQAPDGARHEERRRAAGPSEGIHVGAAVEHLDLPLHW